MCTSVPQTITNAKSTAATAATLIHLSFASLSASSIPTPVQRSMTPIVVKSIAVQTTSVVNFIAMKGMRSSDSAATRMRISLLVIIFLTAVSFRDDRAEDNVQQAETCGHHQ